MNRMCKELLMRSTSLLEFLLRLFDPKRITLLLALANKCKLLLCPLICPSSPSFLVLQALTNVHELLYHSAMDPSRVPGPWLKSSAFAALESRLPVTLPAPLSPRGVCIELKCRCPPLGSISFIFMMNKLSKFDKSCCHSHISFVFVLSKSYKDSALFTSASEDCGKQKSTLASSCVTNYIFWQRFYRLHMSRLNLCSKLCHRGMNHRVRGSLAHQIWSSQELTCQHLIPSLSLLEEKPNTPLPAAPGLPSRHPSLFPFLCHVSLQLHSQCGFPLKFPCCLALYWLSPILVYHQHIWQVHSLFLPCSCCWLENKRGFIEPSPLYSPASLLSQYSQHFSWRGLSLDFSSFHAQKRVGKRHPWDCSPVCVHTP